LHNFGELVLVKGQGKFIVVLVDLETDKLLGLAPERKQSEIEKVMLRWGDKVLSQVEEVTMDMSYNYKWLVNKLCPDSGSDGT
jgi:transposase